MSFKTGLLLAAAGFGLMSGAAYAGDGDRTAHYGSTKAAIGQVAAPVFEDVTEARTAVAKDSAGRVVNDYREGYVQTAKTVQPAVKKSSVANAPVVIDLMDRGAPSFDVSASPPVVKSEMPRVPVGAVSSEAVETVSSGLPEDLSASAPVFYDAEALASAEAADVVSFEPASGESQATGSAHTEPAQVAPKASGSHWGYFGAEAAQHWGELSPEYATCSTGRKQSPVNIARFARRELPPIGFSYSAVPLVVVNNGHTIQVDYAPGSEINVGGQNFKLVQFHFHTPSEHYLDGSPYPMEVHFVHKSDSGKLAVVGAMMKVGAHNKVLDGVWQNAPAQAGRKVVEAAQINAADLLPQSKEYYQYDGSLTTPPCSEDVAWHVLKKPIEISQKQLQVFQEMFPVNARPVQPLAGRVVRGD